MYSNPRMSDPRRRETGNEGWSKRRIFLVVLISCAIIILILAILFIVLVLFGTDASFHEKCVDAHNRYRKIHGSPGLELNETLKAHAAETAEMMASTKQSEYQPDGLYGENLYVAFGVTYVSCEKAVDAWYSEKRKFNFKSGVLQPGTGHFTQLVWKSSTNLGCAMANGSDIFYLVCEYEPAGNIEGRVKLNVLRL